MDKLSKLKKKDEVVCKNSKKKDITKKISLETSNFSVLTMAARRLGDDIFKMLITHVKVKLCDHSL